MIDLSPFVLRAGKWIGTGAGILGAVLIALNLNVNHYGFALFLVSSLLWSAIALIQREQSLLVLQITFTAVNVLGLWRWWTH